MIKATLTCDGCGEQKTVTAKSGTYRKDLMHLGDYKLMRQMILKYIGYDKPVPIEVTKDFDRAYMMCPRCYAMVENLTGANIDKINKSLSDYFNRFIHMKWFDHENDNGN